MTFKLIVGLGNPGAEYEGTRHNAGFIVVDRLADDLGARYWKNECGALVAHVRYEGAELLVAKPQAFMNVSGGPVSKLAAAYDVKPRELLVVHDDMDLEPGSIRVKARGGHGGHNGLKSIHAKLGSDAYARVRVGLGHPPGRKPAADFVLQVPRGQDAEAFEAALDRALLATKCALAHGVDKAMNDYN